MAYATNTARLNAKTKKQAYKAGTVWTDDDVSTLVSMIEADATTFDMAMATNRTYYGASYARSHVAFAMRHQRVIMGHIAPARRSGKKATASAQ